MAKFMVLYYSDSSARELMSNATPEQMQSSMTEWITWREKASQAANIEFGLPLQAVSRINTEGVADSDSQVSGYSIIEGATKETVVELLKDHPHLKRDGAYMDVLEMLSMPGLDT